MYPAPVFALLLVLSSSFLFHLPCATSHSLRLHLHLLLLLVHLASGSSTPHCSASSHPVHPKLPQRKPVLIDGCGDDFDGGGDISCELFWMPFCDVVLFVQKLHHLKELDVAFNKFES